VGFCVRVKPEAAENLRFNGLFGFSLSSYFGLDMSECSPAFQNLNAEILVEQSVPDSAPQYSSFGGLSELLSELVRG
jgi:hypothetical protein